MVPSTLARGNEIERDFYELKSQEWAVSFDEAKTMIERALVQCSRFAQDRYRQATDNQ